MSEVTINTGRRVYTALYAGIGLSGQFKAQIYDTRRLPVLAAELDGVQTLICTRKAGERMVTETFEGYTRLARLETLDDEMTLIVLRQEDAHDAV